MTATAATALFLLVPMKDAGWFAAMVSNRHPCAAIAVGAAATTATTITITITITTVANSSLESSTNDTDLLSRTMDSSSNPN